MEKKYIYFFQQNGSPFRFFLYIFFPLFRAPIARLFASAHHRVIFRVFRRASFPLFPEKSSIRAHRRAGTVQAKRKKNLFFFSFCPPSLFKRRRRWKMRSDVFPGRTPGNPSAVLPTFFSFFGLSRTLLHITV
jgi:hypothetical protein